MALARWVTSHSPMMTVSGVRSSWLTSVKKRRREASMAARRAGGGQVLGALGHGALQHRPVGGHLAGAAEEALGHAVELGHQQPQLVA